MDNLNGWVSFTKFAILCNQNYGISGKELKETLPNLIKMGFVETKEINGELHYRITKKGEKK